MSRVKRPDIQGIRGLAIAAVLGFHLREQQFPAGFVGVDIFFVLSGYLMSSILARERALTLGVLKTFYIRRFKRIAPLYAILLFILFFAVPLILMKRDVFKFVVDVVWASFFSTNMLSIVEEVDYFTELRDSNVLTHTWSLGVEIQYYLIVPFIYSIQRVLGSRLTMGYLVFLITASFSFQLVTSPNVSFNFLLSRVWQFLGGAVAHEIISWHAGNNNNQICDKKYSGVTSADVLLLLEDGVIGGDEKSSAAMADQIFKYNPLPILSTGIAVVLFIFALSPILLLASPILRLIAVALTAAAIIIGHTEEHQSVVFTNPFMVYLGDVSYVVYLVHWPVIIMWKSYWDQPQISDQDIILCLSVTFAISAVVHRTLEQYFISTSTTAAAAVVGVIYVVMLFGIFMRVPQAMNNAVMDANAAPSAIADAIEWNEWESHSEYYYARPFPDCVDDKDGAAMTDGYNEQPPYLCIYNANNTDGFVDVLVLGNSVAHRASKILYDILKDYSELRSMRVFAQSACRPLESSCEGFFSAADMLIKASQPDITFLIYDDSEILRAPILNIKEDEARQAFERYLKFQSENSRFVVLDEFYPQPSSSVGIAASMYKRLLRNQTIADLKEEYQPFLDSYSNYFKRLDAIRIGNMRRHNTSGPLCAEDPGWCWWYNRSNLHAYFTDNVHMSMDGLMLQRVSYKAILDDLIVHILAIRAYDDK